MNAPTPPDELRPEAPRRSLAMPAGVSLLLVLANFALAGWAWPQLPDNVRVPTHWNLAGEADAYGGRASIFLLPGVMAGVTLLFLVIPRFDPRRNHLLKSSRAYAAIWLTVIGVLTGLNLAVVLTVLGHPVAMDKWMLLSLGVLCVVAGNFFGKIRSNFFVGIRTPWTLSSELSWNKTHRLGGWAFAVFGLLLIVAGIAQLPSRVVFVLLVVLPLVLVLALAAYSYFIWRDDPNRAKRPSLNS